MDSEFRAQEIRGEIDQGLVNGREWCASARTIRSVVSTRPLRTILVSCRALPIDLS